MQIKLLLEKYGVKVVLFKILETEIVFGATTKKRISKFGRDRILFHCYTLDRFECFM